MPSENLARTVSDFASNRLGAEPAGNRLGAEPAGNRLGAEPAGAAVLGTALAGLAASARRRKRPWRALAP